MLASGLKHLGTFDCAIWPHVDYANAGAGKMSRAGFGWNLWSRRVDREFPRWLAVWSNRRWRRECGWSNREQRRNDEMLHRPNEKERSHCWRRRAW